MTRCGICEQVKANGKFKLILTDCVVKVCEQCYRLSEVLATIRSKPVQVEHKKGV